MIRIIGVAGPVKSAVRLVKTAFEHIEHIFMPCYHLVAVAVFYAHTSKNVYPRHFVRTQAMHLFAEHLSCIV